jgi:uncharacterized membrane protein
MTKIETIKNYAIIVFINLFIMLIVNIIGFMIYGIFCWNCFYIIFIANILGIFFIEIFIFILEITWKQQ